MTNISSSIHSVFILHFVVSSLFSLSLSRKNYGKRRNLRKKKRKRERERGSQEKRERERRKKVYIYIKSVREANDTFLKQLLGGRRFPGESRAWPLRLRCPQRKRRAPTAAMPMTASSRGHRAPRHSQQVGPNVSRAGRAFTPFTCGF